MKFGKDNTTDTETRNKPTAVDLFSGCGGLTLGLKTAGFDVLGAVDVDPLASETYKANHDGVVVWEKDIRLLKIGEISASLGLRKGDLDLLAGCPPCQGFSTLRTLNGHLDIDDSRNDLLFDFLRFVEGLRPRTVMLENVPGLASDAIFRVFCSKMRKIGYLGQQRILDAAEYGVPQRRRRLIYVAGIRVEVPFAVAMDGRFTVRDTIAGLQNAGGSNDPVHDIPEKRSPRIKRLIRLIPKNGGSRTDLPTEEQLECHKKCGGFKDVYGRMAWDDVAPTITSGCFNPSKGRFLHPEANRAITLREAALLQGFPSEYNFLSEKGKSAVASLIGNALPPPFVAAHARMIREVLQRKRVGNSETERYT